MDTGIGQFIGGLGLGYGMGQYVVVDQPGNASTAQGDQTPKPRDLAKAANAGPLNLMAGFGMFPGFGAHGALDLATLWLMSLYPMVRKVHARITKPVIAGTRGIEIEDDGGNADLAEKIRQAAQRDLLKPLAQAMPGAMESPLFGHWSQEVIWQRINGRIAPVRVRAVQAIPIPHTNEFREFTGVDVAGIFLPLPYVFHAVHDAHIDPVLGRSCNQAALSTWFRSTKSAEMADSIESKAAGIQMLLYYMQGVQLLDDGGAIIDVKTVLTQIMNAAKQGQSAAIPAMAFSKDSIEQNPDRANVPWLKHELIDWGNIGPNLEAHLKRKRELDVDVCSAWGVPERAVMEAARGGMGTSDAETHSDVVLAISEQLHANSCAQWDDQITSPWLKANFGDTPVKIKTVPAPLADPQQEYRQKLFLAMATNTDVDPQLKSIIDVRKLAEGTEVPVRSEKDAAAELKNILAQKQADAEAKSKLASDNAPTGGRFAQQNGNGKKAG